MAVSETCPNISRLHAGFSRVHAPPAAAADRLRSVLDGLHFEIRSIARLGRFTQRRSDRRAIPSVGDGAKPLSGASDARIPRGTVEIERGPSNRLSSLTGPISTVPLLQNFFLSRMGPLPRGTGPVQGRAAMLGRYTSGQLATRGAITRPREGPKAQQWRATDGARSLGPISLWRTPSDNG